MISPLSYGNNSKVQSAATGAAQMPFKDFMKTQQKPFAVAPAFSEGSKPPKTGDSQATFIDYDA